MPKQAFIGDNLGSNYVDASFSDFTVPCDESNNLVPIMCLFSGNSDPVQSILALSEAKSGAKTRVKLMAVGHGFVSRLVSIFSNHFKIPKLPSPTGLSDDCQNHSEMRC